MSTDRTKPEHWEIQRKEFLRYAKKPLEQYTKYARRFAGDFSEVPFASQGGEMSAADKPALCNMMNLSTRVAVGDLYLRDPRFLVRPPGSFNKTLFTPLLARLETTLLNDFARETNLFAQMHLSIMDGLLGPYMVTKVMFDFDLAVDDTRFFEQRMAAQIEDAMFLAIGKKPMMKDDDFHEVHADQHRKTIAAAERGEIQMPDSAIKYLRKHVQKHEEAVPWSRSAETMRNMSVHARRVNPRCYMFDAWNEDVKRREWVGESYIARMDDVMANPEFRRKAKSSLKPATEIFAQDDVIAGLRGQHSFATSHDQHVRIFEILDLVEGKVIKYAEGGTEPLEVSDYKLIEILPSGPYVESSFMPDPLHNFGVCLPYIYEAPQEALAALAGVNVQTVLSSAPSTAYNSNAITPEERAKHREFGVGADYPIPLVGDQKMTDMVMQMPPVEVPAQNLTYERVLKAWVEITTGHGPQKMQGGDSSDTATEASIRSDAANAISGQLTAVLDNHMTRIGIYAARYHRTFLSPMDVYERVGDDALLPGGWPPKFAMRDILMDRGVGVIPGSSKRNNTAVETNQLKETLGMLLPLVGTLIPPEFAMEVIRRMLESVGIMGMDYDGALDTMIENALAQATEGGAPGASAGASAEPQRRSEFTEPSRSGMEQGIRNVGGGRAGRMAGAA